MFDLLKALAAGLLANIVRKLGPSIILFAYVWAQHSKLYQHIGQQLLGVPSNVWLAVIVIMLGVASLAFKDTVSNLSRAMDRRAMPYLHSLVLRHINHHDLSFANIQRNTGELLTGLKSGSIFALLIVVAAFSFPLFALVLLAVLAAIGMQSLRTARLPANATARTFFERLKTHPEYYAEVLVIAGLVLAFMMVASEKSFVSGTVFIVIVSRFSNEIKTMAKSLVGLRRTQLNMARTWANRAIALEKREQRKAEAEALKAERLAAAARRQAEWAAKRAQNQARAEAMRKKAAAAPAGESHLPAA